MNRMLASAAALGLGAALLAALPAQAATVSSPAGVPAPATGQDLSAGLMVKYKADVASTLRVGDPLPGATPRALHLTAGAPTGMGWVAAEFPTATSAATAQASAERLRADPAIAYAEPQVIATAADASNTPNDPLWNEQWGFAAYGDDTFVTPADGHLLGAEVTGTNLVPALGAQHGSAPVVAVIDTGITNHPDLGGRILPGYNFISDPVRAGNATGRGPDASDTGDWVTAEMAASLPFSLGGCLGPRNSSWHGTHVTGTVTAVTDNNLGVAGTAPVQVQPLRVLGHCGGGSGDIAAAMIWAAGGTVPGVPANPTPARVVNLSLGWTGACPQHMQDAVDFGRSRGTVYVVAAGNSNMDAADFGLASCRGVVAVAAADETGGRAYFSNYGSGVAIAAPGFNVMSTLNSGLTTPSTPTYASYSGTSMATPHVVGALALLLAQQPALSADQAEARLKATATPFKQASQYRNPALDCVGDDPCGAGYLNSAALLGQATAPAPVALPRFQVRDAAAAAGARDPGGVELTASYLPPPGTVSRYRITVRRDDVIVADVSTADTTATIPVAGTVADAFTVTVQAWRGAQAGAAASAMPVPSLAPSVPAPPWITQVTAADTKATVSIAGSFATPNPSATVVTAEPGGAQCQVQELPTWGSCSFDQLTPGVQYTFTAVSRNSEGESAASAPVTATPEASGDPLAPGVPTVTMQGTTANVTWTAAVPAPGRAIDRYYVEAQPGIGLLQSCTTLTASQPAITACQLGNLVVGQTYTFTVTAFDDLGKRAVSGESPPVLVGGTATVPSMPDMPPIISVGDGNATASVDPSGISDFNGGAQMIALRMIASPGGASCDISWDDVMAGLISGSGSSCIIGGLTNGQAYTFTSVGVNATGASPPSNASTPYTPNPPESLFAPLATPVRVYDSRQQGGPLVPEVPVVVDLPAPRDAVAVAYNVTVTGTTAPGNAVVGPGDAPLEGTSTINWFGAGQTLANGYVSALGHPDADLQLIVRGGPAQLVLDIVGYYLPTAVGAPTKGAQSPTGSAPATGAGGILDTLVYVPLDPGTRVFDTRTAGGPIRDGQSRTVDVAAAVPAGARAVAYTLTEFDTVGSGHLTVGLPGQPTPATSTINWFADGQRLANSTVAAVDGQRALQVAAGGRAAGFALDVLGYFTTRADAPQGLRFHPITPARAYDSRSPGAGGVLLAGQHRSTRAAPLGQLAPPNAKAVACNVTVVDTVGAGHLRLAPGETAALPPTSAINWYQSGQRLANGTTLGIRDGRMTTFAGSGAAQYVVDVAGYYF